MIRRFLKQVCVDSCAVIGVIAFFFAVFAPYMLFYVAS